jgi:hypothetical protein
MGSPRIDVRDLTSWVLALPFSFCTRSLRRSQPYLPFAFALLSSLLDQASVLRRFRHQLIAFFFPCDLPALL